MKRGAAPLVAIRPPALPPGDKCPLLKVTSFEQLPPSSAPPPPALSPDKLLTTPACTLAKPLRLAVSAAWGPILAITSEEGEGLC